MSENKEEKKQPTVEELQAKVEQSRLMKEVMYKRPFSEPIKVAFMRVTSVESKIVLQPGHVPAVNIEVTMGEVKCLKDVKVLEMSFVPQHEFRLNPVAGDIAQIPNVSPWEQVACALAQKLGSEGK